MARRVTVVILLLLAFAAAGLFVPYIQKLRGTSDLVRSRNNLRELARFAAHYAEAKPGRPADPTLLDQIPAGTVYLPGVSPEDRLSWVVRVLPGLDQKRQDAAGLMNRIDTKLPWAAAPNQVAARTKLPVMLCPANPAESPPTEPALTNYVGIAGVGTDAATLVIPPGPKPAVPPRAGAFRYDTPTPFDLIADGLSQTLLLGETANDPGPWLRGGPATVRGLNTDPGAKPLIGPGGQFGGCFPNGAHFALADGSVRFFTPQTDAKVLLALATIAGAESEVFVGD